MTSKYVSGVLIIALGVGLATPLGPIPCRRTATKS
jgi:hypothetical protein